MVVIEKTWWVIIGGHKALLRATTSALAKSCKIQKVAYFTHFDKKKTPTSVGVKLCINA